MDAVLQRFRYKYLSYEQELMRLEIDALLPHSILVENGRQMLLYNLSPKDTAALDRLTYIASYSIHGVPHSTRQCRLEQCDGKNPKRQNTRYATHGIHEYKGKFNPQIVHALLNILRLKPGDTVFDPFCGSGTTLVESAICGVSSYGTDLNPLAVQLSNLKVQALRLDCAQAERELEAAVRRLSAAPGGGDPPLAGTPREEYLLNWLPRDTFFLLERLRRYTEAMDGVTGLLFRICASNILREYSLQEPLDLRIRRRTSPMPETPFLEAWAGMIRQQLDCIAHAQPYAGPGAAGLAEEHDIRAAAAGRRLFDAAITSPPYATALPYIDTQRISLVWLGLCQPNHIMELESALIGSREFYRAQKEALQARMAGNADALPEEVISLILELQRDLTREDGFRRKAVPLLLYRYFSDMRKMFGNVRSMLKPGARYALVVGNNKTTIGGTLHVIDTPALLSQIALDTGWRVVRQFPLQTYQRYGLHAKNAITRETLLILEKDAG